MTYLKTLENVGIGLGGTGDIMIEENMFETLVQKALGVDSAWVDYAHVDGYGEVALDDSVFYCDYASDNGLNNLGAWINDDNFIFYISSFEFENSLKKNNNKLYIAISEEVDKHFDV